ncbi:MAG TPA: hypothetical protein VFQ61_14195 [Polyangiaceae bacterium]|nr:hypothetical protein [Polyangiaceae bacterium]
MRERPSNGAGDGPGSEELARVDDEALLCALVLAPSTFSRNRFFGLFEGAERKRLRRRAARVRGIIRQLVHPERGQAEIVGERVLNDGRVLLRYTLDQLGYMRTASLSPLEAATLRFALHRAGRGELPEEDRKLVETSLARLSGGLSVALEG